MQRPQVRQIDAQKVDSEREVTGWEADEILRKYGYGEQKYSSIPDNSNSNVDHDLTFEEMVKRNQEKNRIEIEKQNQMVNGPKPITFDGNRGWDSEVKWSSDEETGFGFKIEITSDMRIPK